jgi:hypothetical protein
MADAAAAVPGTDPDRASFCIALDAARDQVILAGGNARGNIDRTTRKAAVNVQISAAPLTAGSVP